MKRSRETYGDISAVCRFRVKEILAERNLSQSWLAEKAGVSTGQITHVVRGEWISIPMLAKIAIALGVEMSDLFARTGWMDDEYSDVDFSVQKSKKKEYTSRKDMMSNDESYTNYDVQDLDLTRADYKRIREYLHLSARDVARVLIGKKEITVNQWRMLVHLLKYKSFAALTDVRVRVNYEMVMTPVCSFDWGAPKSHVCLDYDIDECSSNGLYEDIGGDELLEEELALAEFEKNEEFDV